MILVKLTFFSFKWKAYTIAWLIFLLPSIFYAKNSWSQSASINKEYLSLKIKSDYSAFEGYESVRKKLLINESLASDNNLFAAFARDSAEYEWLIENFGRPEYSVKRNRYADFIMLPGNSDVLLSFISSAFDKIFIKALNNENQRSNIFAWSWGYLGEACILAYSITSDERFLNIFIESFDQILKFRDIETKKYDSYHQKFMNSWGSGIHKNGEWISHVTTTGRITFPVAWFIRIINTNPKLMDKYGEKSKKYLDVVSKAIEDHIEDYKEFNKPTEGYFVRAGFDQIEPLNHAHSIGNTIALLYQITKNKKYFNIAVGLSNYFLYRTNKESNGSYSWPYNPGIENFDDLKPEPFWKAQITTRFSHVAYEAGIVFDKNDMIAMAKTFTLNIFRGQNKYNKFISSNKKKFMNNSELKYRGKIKTLTGWIYFDRFDPNVEKIISKAIAYNTDIFDKGWFSHYANAIAYAYRIQTRFNKISNAK